MLVTPSKRNPSKLELLQPVADVAEQEPLHLVLAVVEEHRVPAGVLAARPAWKYW